MKQKIYIFDYDGTICETGKFKIPERISKLIFRLQADNIVVLATGRPDFLVPADDRVNWNAQIYYNGQLCVVGNNVIYSKQLDYIQFQKFAVVAKNIDIEFVAFSNRPVFSNTKINMNIPKEVIGNFSDSAPILKEFGVYKLIVEPSNKAETLVRQLIPNSQINKWSSDFWEVVPQNVNKLTGIAHFLSYVSADWSNVIAFGDGENDFPVFQKAAVSIAVGENCSSIKNIATFNVPNFANNGVEWAFENLRLLEEI